MSFIYLKICLEDKCNHNLLSLSAAALSEQPSSLACVILVASFLVSLLLRPFLFSQQPGRSF